MMQVLRICKYSAGPASWKTGSTNKKTGCTIGKRLIPGGGGTVEFLETNREDCRGSVFNEVDVR